MATTPESQLKYKIKAYLETRKPHVWWDSPVRTGYDKRGVPDFTGLLCGFFWSIETKAPGKKPSPWQEREITAIMLAGGFHITCDSWESFMTQWAPFEEKAMMYAARG